MLTQVTQSGFFKVPWWIFQFPKFIPTILKLISLASTSRDGTIVTPIRSLALDCGVSKSSLERLIVALRDAGHIRDKSETKPGQISFIDDFIKWGESGQERAKSEPKSGTRAQNPAKKEPKKIISNPKDNEEEEEYTQDGYPIFPNEKIEKFRRQKKIALEPNVWMTPLQERQLIALYGEAPTNWIINWLQEWSIDTNPDKDGKIRYKLYHTYNDHFLLAKNHLNKMRQYKYGAYAARREE